MSCFCNSDQCHNCNGTGQVQFVVTSQAPTRLPYKFKLLDAQGGYLYFEADLTADQVMFAQFLQRKFTDLDQGDPSYTYPKFEVSPL